MELFGQTQVPSICRHVARDRLQIAGFALQLSENDTMSPLSFRLMDNMDDLDSFKASSNAIEFREKSTNKI